METSEKTNITIKARIKAPVEKVWTYWNDPAHIVRWNAASEDWHTTWAKNDLQVGSKIISRMEAKDGSMGFDFSGTYTRIESNKHIEYVLDDNRKVMVEFSGNGSETEITETFEAETSNPVEMQKAGWQAILDNFKKYAEQTETEVLRFDIAIPAPVETVYRTMLNEKTYAEWTSVFNASSSYRGSWKKGSKILFIGIEEEKEGGMVARIKENLPNEFVSIEHLGIYNDGEEITSGPDVEAWTGALENYTFTQKGEQTVVSVDIDIVQSYKDYFLETWPKALEKLKEICTAG